MQTGSLRILTTFHPFIPLALNSNKQAGPPALNITYVYFKIKRCTKTKTKTTTKKTKTSKKQLSFFSSKEKSFREKYLTPLLVALKVFLEDL